MLLIRKDDIPVYHDKIIISKPGGILPIPPNFNTEYKITVGPRPFPYQNTGMTNQASTQSSNFVDQF